jgi:hypothetical protein
MRVNIYINNNKKIVIDGRASSIRMTSRPNHQPILANNSLVFLSYEHMLLISLFLFAVKERQCTWLLAPAASCNCPWIYRHC